MNSLPLRIERDGAVVILTLNAPALRNALSDGMMLALAAALRAADADPAIGCVVVTGAAEGKAFCSGGNLREMAEQGSPMFRGAPVATQNAYRNLIQQVPLAFHAIEVPVVAAINGPAIGAGLDIATMCDIRIASSEARFAESFLRAGLISGDGGAWFLPRTIGLARALELALTCEVIDAEQARAIGLISRIVMAADLLPEALAIAARIAAQPRDAARLTKRLFRESLAVSLQQSLDHAAALQSIVQKTDDHHEAVSALLEKRSPVFTGR